MPLSNELFKRNAKLSRTCPKCNPRASKCKKEFEEASHTPRGAGPILHLPWLGTRCQDGGCAPICWSLPSQQLSWLFQTLAKTLIRYTINALRQILHLPMYKLTFYSLKISPKITPDLNMGQKLRSINIHEKKLIWTLDHDAASFCILTMRCLKIEVRMLQKQ